MSGWGEAGADFGLRIADGGLQIAPPMPPRRRAPSAIRDPQSAIDWGRIRLFAMDVDGVLTDGTVFIASDGSEAKGFSILDGMGLRQLARAGIIVAWISGRPSPATARRARELEIPHLVQGRTDKIDALQEIAAQLRFDAAECAYMGDDSIDVPAMGWAGVGIAPPGAMAMAIAAADYVTTRPAGHGAVREVCEHLLSARGAKPRSTRRKAGSEPR